MKKVCSFILFFVATFSGYTTAQTLTPVSIANGYWGTIPKIHTLDGKPRFVITNEEYTQYTIYREDLTEERVVNILAVDSVKSGRSIKERAAVWNENFGREFYTGEWEEVGYVYNYGGIGFEDIFDEDMDNNLISGEVYDFSQNIYNNDDKYEYAAVVYEQIVGEVVETDRDGDGIIDRIEQEFSRNPSKFIIASEDGTILVSMPIEGYEDVSVNGFKIGGAYYIEIEKYYYEYNIQNERTFYRVDKSDNSALQLTAMPAAKMKLYPTVVKPEEGVTLEIPAGEKGLVRVLYITNAVGQLVDSRTIAADETQTRINISRLTSGLYHFTVKEGVQIVDSGKIIVK